MWRSAPVILFDTSLDRITVLFFCWAFSFAFFLSRPCGLCRTLQFFVYVYVSPFSLLIFCAARRAPGCFSSD